STLYDSFIFDLSINPFPLADRSDFYEFADELAHIISQLEYDFFSFKNEPNSRDFTMDVVDDTFPTREPRVQVHNVLPTHPTLKLNLDFILSNESLFTYVVWIFLPFLLYSVVPQYLLSLGNEDTIFLSQHVQLSYLFFHAGWSLGDKIICDLDKTPDLFQQSPQNCPKCGNPVNSHYCQGCALLQKKFKEDLFTSCVKNGIPQDSFEPSNDNTNVANALREPFVVNQDPGIFCHQCTCELCGNGAHYGYNCSSKVPIIPNPKPFNNQTIRELPQTLPSFDPTCYSEDGNSFTYDSKSNLVHDSPNIFDPPSQPPLYSCEFCRNDAHFSACYDDDDDDYAISITHKEPDNSLSMGDEHLDTISATESDEFIKSSVENLVPNPGESESENECDMPACEDFTTFSNIFYDADYDFYSVDDQSFSDEDIPKEIYSNPLFDEEIISMKIDPHHFNVESDLIESLLNRNSLIISSSSKIDSLFDEFAGELTLLKSIPPGINETDCDLEEETHFIKRLLYDNSSPQIDLSLTPDDPMPPDIKEDDYDSEGDILILKEFLSNDSLLFSENESFHFDIPSSSCPLVKPPNSNT
nr:hypothetical protein [Tanacetum cinerariifolium]